MKFPQVGRRRASVSDFHPRSFLENCKSPGFSQKLDIWHKYAKGVASVVGLSSNSLPSFPQRSPIRKSTTEIPNRSCSLPVASNDLQSPETVFDESTQPLLKNTFCKKKARSKWTRKLSAVTDEKEQSEDESDKKTENVDQSEITQEQFLLRAFLQQVEQKNNEFGDHFDDQFDVLTDLPDEIDSADDKWENIQLKILQYIHDSAVGKYLYLPVIEELWQQNSTSTIARYFCSTILAFIAFCFLFFFDSTLYRKMKEVVVQKEVTYRCIEAEVKGVTTRIVNCVVTTLLSGQDAFGKIDAEIESNEKADTKQDRQPTQVSSSLVALLYAIIVARYKLKRFTDQTDSIKAKQTTLRTRYNKGMQISTDRSRGKIRYDDMIPLSRDGSKYGPIKKSFAIFAHIITENSS
ncbi:uncharacterized protein CEXT_765191 [Caerostris extrusa]|uniref:Uncharacterized protein n=1 Tax=Caerostris extrusa TaxID=172846 RepID=A0AAV4M6V9_CAEEX|nr:uncharacterized protein CEXT_765191 [Caerostris extrusa]